MKNMTTNKGVSMLGLIFLIVLAFLFINFFDITIKPAWPSALKNEQKDGEGLQAKWEGYVVKPVRSIWQKVFVKIFWDEFVGRIKSGNFIEFTQPEKKSSDFKEKP